MWAWIFLSLHHNLAVIRSTIGRVPLMWPLITHITVNLIFRYFIFFSNSPEIDLEIPHSNVTTWRTVRRVGLDRFVNGKGWMICCGHLRINFDFIQRMDSIFSLFYDYCVQRMIWDDLRQQMWIKFNFLKACDIFSRMSSHCYWE